MLCGIRLVRRLWGALLAGRPRHMGWSAAEEEQEGAAYGRASLGGSLRSRGSAYGAGDAPLEGVREPSKGQTAGMGARRRAPPALCGQPRLFRRGARGRRTTSAPSEEPWLRSAQARRAPGRARGALLAVSAASRCP